MKTPIWVKTFIRFTGFTPSQVARFTVKFQDRHPQFKITGPLLADALPHVLSGVLTIDEFELSRRLVEYLQAGRIETPEDETSRRSDSVDMNPSSSEPLNIGHVMDFFDSPDREKKASELLNALSRSVPGFSRVSDADLVTALGRAKAKGAVTPFAVAELLRERRNRRSEKHRKASRPTKKSSHRNRSIPGPARRRDPSIKGRSVAMEDLGECPHGVPKFYICAICEPERYEDMVGRD